MPTLYRTLIASPEPWAARPLKFKTPWEWAISALRGLGRDQIGQLQMAGVQSQLGQPVWKPGSPAGWDDTAASWAAPDALLRRVEYAQRLVAPVAANLDALFDRGLISFADDGEMLVSSRLGKSVRKLLRLERPLRKQPNRTQRRYLADHRRRWAFDPA